MAVDEMTFVNFCSNGHSQISYTTEACPVCEMRQVFIDELQTMRKELDQIDRKKGSGI